MLTDDDENAIELDGMNSNDRESDDIDNDGDLDADDDGDIGDDNAIDSNATNVSLSYVRRRKCNENVPVCEKKRKRESYRRIASILRKTESSRTPEEIRLLESSADIVRQVLKRRELHANSKERVLEKEDPPDVIQEKARKLAEVLSRAQHLVCYTGAGISTSARIPDYRGSQGIWTLLQQGKEIGQHDLTLAEPTFTHMALYELHRRNILRYTLSQNCDGLHLRSGLPRKSLSEVHGNMYIEVCVHCKPNVEYWRLFDTTELTARFNHSTNRRCHFCFGSLSDTIVHFGERGKLKWPLNWDGACKNAEKADVILCLGSSLKVLKKYSWLWSMDRSKNKRPKIYIVNLQWTPKDKSATIKINGKCDEVMKLVMDFMEINVTKYNRMKDPIFGHATLLKAEELHTVSQPMLKRHIVEENSTDTNESDSVKVETATQSDDTNEGVCETKTISNGTKIKDETQEDTDNDLHATNSEPNQLTDNRSEYDTTNIDSMKSNVNSNTCDSKATTTITTSAITIETTKNVESDNFSQSILTDKEIDTKPVLSVDSKAECSVHDSEISQKQIVNIHERLNQLLVMNQTQLLQSQSQTLSHTLAINSNDQNGLNTSQQSTTDNAEYYKSLIKCYRAIDGVVPHWYDVNYAYSGLHSIIHPPPNGVDLWGSIIIPIFQLNRSVAECEFCFDNYAEDKCQFYRSSQEFCVSPKYRRGKLILCECCDNSDDDEVIDDGENRTSDSHAMITANGDDDDSAKKMKCDGDVVGMSTAKTQPGWYGKGCRKNIRKRKRRCGQSAQET